MNRCSGLRYRKLRQISNRRQFLVGIEKQECLELLNENAGVETEPTMGMGGFDGTRCLKRLQNLEIER